MTLPTYIAFELNASIEKFVDHMELVVYVDELLVEILTQLPEVLSDLEEFDKNVEDFVHHQLETYEIDKDGDDGRMFRRCVFLMADGLRQQIHLHGFGKGEGFPYVFHKVYDGTVYFVLASYVEAKHA